MKYTIYIDVLVVTNIIINYWLLRTAALCLGHKQHNHRLILASFIGALFSVAIIFRLSLLTSLLLKISAVAVSSSIAFGVKTPTSFSKNTICLTAVTFLFSGMVEALFQNSKTVLTRNWCIYPNISPIMLVICIFTVYVIMYICEIIFTYGKKDYYFNTEIHYDNKKINLISFYDTGFNVKDIIGFKKVMICSFNTLKEILPSELAADVSDFYASGKYTNKNIIPVFYSTVDKDGMIPGIIPAKVLLHKENRVISLENVIIALTQRPVSAEYQMIFGKDIYNLTGE